ncbi:MAG TPA: tryptophan synthase subunit alpha [Burkholderiales bacterium]
MSRIQATFSKLQAQKKKALIPFVTAGDPTRAMTVPIMHALVSAGADIVELGVPFSDPMADGPTIQRSSERALKHGTSLTHVLGIVKEFRARDATTPVVLMGYANPIEAMGLGEFAKAAQAAGVDGVLVVDYPPEEGGSMAELLKVHGIDSIFLLSPTTQDSRMEQIGHMATGYIYYVSLKGVTGAATLDLKEVAAKIPQIRSHIKLPIGVGFGIRDAETAKAIAAVSDAVVIGSRLVQEIEGSAADKVLGNISTLLGGIRRAMDGA